MRVVMCLLLTMFGLVLLLGSVAAQADTPQAPLPAPQLESLPPDASPGAQLAPPGALQPQPLGTYRLELSCWDGERLVMETEVNVLEGFPADIKNERWRYPGVAFPGLVLIRPAVATAFVSQPGLWDAPPAILAAAQQFELADLCLTVYCPGANWLAATAYWSDEIDGARLDALTEEDWCLLECLETPLCTPDQGFVDPGGYPPPSPLPPD